MRPNGVIDGQPVVKRRRGRRKNVEGMDLLFMNKSRVPTVPDQVSSCSVSWAYFLVSMLCYKSENNHKWQLPDFFFFLEPIIFVKSALLIWFLFYFMAVLQSIQCIMTCSYAFRYLQGGGVLARWAWLQALHQATVRTPVRSLQTLRAGSRLSTWKMAPGWLGMMPPGGKNWSSG